MNVLLLGVLLLTAAAQEDAPLAVDIVPLVDPAGSPYLPHGKPFEVRFTNRSDQPVKIWAEYCQPEHETLSFLHKDGSGSTTVCRKREVHGNAWKDHPPKALTIPPKETLSRKVEFNGFFWGHQAWKNAPEPNSGEKTEIKVVLEIRPGKEAVHHGVWTGRVESPPLSVRIVNPELSTPHKYLRHDCPKMALKLMKEDPTWIHRKDPEDECTPLHHAARFGPKEVVAWLIENKADVNAVAYNGVTPLHLTTTRDIAELLIKGGRSWTRRTTGARPRCSRPSTSGAERSPRRSWLPASRSISRPRSRSAIAPWYSRCWPTIRISSPEARGGPIFSATRLRWAGRRPRETSSWSGCCSMPARRSTIRRSCPMPEARQLRSATPSGPGRPTSWNSC